MIWFKLRDLHKDDAITTELERSLSTSVTVLFHLFICSITGSNPMNRRVNLETNIDHDYVLQRE